jgi:hypothetical protein
MGIPPQFEFVIPGAVVLVLVSLWGQFLAFRCPECRGNLGQLYLHNTVLFGGSKVKFCPFCGLELNLELRAVEDDEFKMETVEG